MGWTKRVGAFSRVRTCAFFRILELKSSALDHSAMKARFPFKNAPAGNRTRVAWLGTIHDNHYTTGAPLCVAKGQKATSERFELPRGDPM